MLCEFALGGTRSQLLGFCRSSTLLTAHRADFVVDSTSHQRPKDLAETICANIREKLWATDFAD